MEPNKNRESLKNAMLGVAMSNIARFVLQKLLIFLDFQKVLRQSENDLKTCKFVILGENIRQKQAKNYRLKNPKTMPCIFFQGNKFACLTKANFYRIQFKNVVAFSYCRKPF